MASARWQAARMRFASYRLARLIKPTARAIAVLGVGPRVEDRLHQLGHRRTDGVAPRHQPGWGPFQMGTVCGRHVLTLGEEALSAVPTGVAGHAPTPMKDPHYPGGGAHFHGLTCQLVRHRVITG